MEAYPAGRKRQQDRDIADIARWVVAGNHFRNKYGTKLGSHQISGLLGKGGMGEVYRARDAKLDFWPRWIINSFAV